MGYGAWVPYSQRAYVCRLPQFALPPWPMTIGVAFSLPSTADSFLFSIVLGTSARSSPISAALSRRPTDDKKLFLFASCSLSRNVGPPALSFFTHRLFMLILLPLFMIAVMHFCRGLATQWQRARSAPDSFPASSWGAHVHLLLYSAQTDHICSNEHCFCSVMF